MKRVEYRVTGQAGWNRVDLFEGKKLIDLVHYLKTGKLAREAADALNKAYSQGMADGFEAARQQVLQYGCADFEGADPAKVISAELDVKNVGYED